MVSKDKEVISFRASSVISNWLNKTSKLKDMKLSDLVRDAVEKSVNAPNTLRWRAIEMIGGDFYAYMAKLIHRIENAPADKPVLSSLTREDLHMMLGYFHTAYLHTRSDLIASPKYMMPLLDITEELFAAFDAAKVDYERDFALERIQSNDTDTLEEALANARSRVDTLRLTCGSAEMKTRPLVVMADHLNHLDTETIERIFTIDRIKTLAPLIGKASTNETKFPHNKALLADFPRTATVNDITLTYHPWDPALYVQHGRARICFTWKDVLSKILRMPRDKVIGEIHRIVNDVGGKNKGYAWDRALKHSPFLESISARLWPVQGQELRMDLMISDNVTLELDLGQAATFFETMYRLILDEADDIENAHLRAATLHYGSF